MTFPREKKSHKTIHLDIHLFMRYRKIRGKVFVKFCTFLFKAHLCSIFYCTSFFIRCTNIYNLFTPVASPLIFSVSFSLRLLRRRRNHFLPDASHGTRKRQDTIFATVKYAQILQAANR